jgi:hypothetical protein
MTVEITIPCNVVPKQFEDSDIQFGQIVLERLREAGVPVVGSVFLRGVSSGRLEMECDDLASDDFIYRWHP